MTVTPLELGCLVALAGLVLAGMLMGATALFRLARRKGGRS